MGICLSGSKNKRKTKVTAICNSSTVHERLLIRMDDCSKKAKHLARSQTRETLLVLIQQQEFDELEQLLNLRDDFKDFIHIYPHPYNGTLLDIACKSTGNSRILHFLLNKSVNPNVLNETTGKAPIHEVVQNADADMLEILTKHDNFESANIVDKDGNTPLHIAVKHNHIRCMQILLENCQKGHSPIDINMSTRENPSPLQLALLLGNMQAARVLFQCPGIDLDFQKDFQGRTCRQIVHQQHPSLVENLSTDPLQNPSIILHSFLNRGLTKLFVRLASEIDPKCLKNGDFWDNGGYLHRACDHGYTDVVEFLINKKVNPNKICKSRIPIMIAARKGYYGIFEKLFHYPKTALQIEGYGSVLHYIIRGMLFCGQVEGRRDHRKCLELVLNEIFPPNKSGTDEHSPLRRLDIDFVDHMGNTPLHLAVLVNDKEIHKSLIYAGAHLYQKNNSGEVPLTLIKTAVLADYMDDCISVKNKSNFETDREINFDYKIFVKSDRNAICRGNEMEFFSIIERVPELRKLLKHPLAESFLHIKWNFVKKYYYVNLIFYLAFCVVLSLHIYQVYERRSSSFIDVNPAISPLLEWNVVISCRIIVLILYVLLVLKELGQLFISPKSYFKSSENWLEIVIISIAGASFVTEALHLNHKSYEAGIILASWIDLMFLIGKLPLCATNIEIFKTVTVNFLKFFALYSIMIVSFAFSFYLLFKEKAMRANNATTSKTNHTGNPYLNLDSINFWQDPVLSFFKTIAMMTGEFSTDSIPFYSTFGSGHLFFILFIFFVTIVLYNLLIGLAVNDTKIIKENVELVALGSRVRLIAQLERVVGCNPFWCFRYLSSKRFQYARSPFYLGISTNTTKEVKLFENDKKLKDYECGDSNGTFSTLKMPTFIVKEAQKVLENQMEFDRSHLCSQHLHVNAVREHPLKFNQSIDKLGQYFDTQIRDLESKINETTAIAKRDEKLLHDVSTLICDFESKIDGRIETLLESVVAKQIEKSLKPIMWQYFDTNIRDLESKINETTAIAAAQRDEKLLHKVSALIGDFESKIDGRIETLLESVVAKQIEKSLEPIVTVLQKLDT